MINIEALKKVVLEQAEIAKAKFEAGVDFYRPTICAVTIKRGWRVDGTRILKLNFSKKEGFRGFVCEDEHFQADHEGQYDHLTPTWEENTKSIFCDLPIAVKNAFLQEDTLAAKRNNPNFRQEQAAKIEWIEQVNEILSTVEL